jgi:hypothetical protein
MRNRGPGIIVVIVLCLGAGLAVPVAAQRAPVVLPAIRHFESPRADLVEPRSAGALVLTDILATRGPERPRFVVPDSAAAAREVQAVASLGATLPLLKLATWREGGAVLVGQGGVLARFRIERPSRDDMGQDWFVALPVEARWRAWSGRFRPSHRSAHIGDEFADATGAQRIEFGGEALDVHVARDIASTRIYAGGSWIWYSYTQRESFLRELDRGDRFIAQLGLDGAWGTRPGGRADLIGSVDVQFAERTGWRRQLSAVGGIRWRGPLQALELVVRVYDGPSAMGQFFATPERFVALELIAAF